MNIRSLNIVFLLILNFGLIFGQSNLDKLSQSLIDVNDSQTEQAYTIYNWITSNIKYDIKSLAKGDYPNLTSQQVINRGQGLCGGFSELFTAMCQSVGIEAYTIHGYSKGYMYNPQKAFLRANHAWNIIFVDSVWKHVDVSWGSGYIDTKPKAVQKALYTIAKIPYSKSKVYFTSSFNDSFFDIPLDSLVSDHYPLDPKWLFNQRPLSIESFQNDTLSKYIEYENYADEIENIRKKAKEYQFLSEGINGNKYNSLNYFDKANAYFNNATLYNLDRELTNDIKWQFDKYYKEYSIIIESINKHKSLSDSIYQLRTKELRQIARDQKKLTSRIKSKAKKAQKTHRSSQKQIVGKNSSYRKKMNGYQINIGRAEIKKVALTGNKEIVYVDTSAAEALLNEIAALKEEQIKYQFNLDSLLNVVDNFSYLDAQVDDSIAMANQMFKSNIEVLWQTILYGDEKPIFEYVDSLKVIYSEIENFLKDKKSAKSDLQITGREFFSNSSLLQKSLKKEMTAKSKLLKLTLNADAIGIKYNSAVDELIACYNKSMVFTKKLTYHNDVQTEVRQENLNALKEQKKAISKENKFFVAWYDNHTKKEKELYTREKGIIKSIKSTSLKNKKTVEMKLKKFSE